MKKEDLIRNLENELEKFKNKHYDTGETRVDLMIYDVLNYIKNESISREEIDEFFSNEEALVEHDIEHIMDDEVTCREYYVNKKIALNDIQKSFIDKFKRRVSGNV